jgi:YidC/Oxa1 family membrane protein insertase
MQRLQPEMEAIRKKYADKPQEMNKQVMLLYQKNKVNPLGGCLPMVVQMPVLFALYFSLMFAIDLRMAPFVSWINDLSAPDTVGRIMGFPIHVLPLIMTVVSVLQARATPTDPRQAAMTTLMPIVFLVFFYTMPAGLVLYWTMTNLGTWLQQWWVNRMDGPAAAASQGAGVVSAPEPGGESARGSARQAGTAGAASAAGVVGAAEATEDGEGSDAPTRFGGKDGRRKGREANRSLPKPRGRA